MSSLPEVEESKIEMAISRLLIACFDMCPSLAAGRKTGR
jgi:hypothetical protein